MKKFLALTLAIIMVFALAVPAFATSPEDGVTVVKAYTYGNNIVWVEFSEPVIVENYYISLVDENCGHWNGGALNTPTNPNSDGSPSKFWSFALTNTYTSMDEAFTSFSGATPCILFEGGVESGVCKAVRTADNRYLKTTGVVAGADRALFPIEKASTVTVSDVYTYGNNLVIVEFSEPVIVDYHWISLVDGLCGHWNDAALDTAINPNSDGSPSARWLFKLSGSFSTMNDVFSAFETDGATPCILFEQTGGAGIAEPGVCKAVRTADNRYLKTTGVVAGADRALFPIEKKDAVKLTSVYTYGDTQLKLKFSEPIKYNGSSSNVWLYTQVYKSNGDYVPALAIQKYYLNLNAPTLSADKKTLTFDMQFQDVKDNIGVSSWKEFFEYYSDETRAGADCKIRVNFQDILSGKSCDGDCNFIESDTTLGKFLSPCSDIVNFDTASAFVELRDEDLVYIDDISRVDDTTLQVTFSEGVKIAEGTEANVGVTVNSEYYTPEWCMDEYHGNIGRNVSLTANFKATDDPSVWNVAVEPINSSGDSIFDFNFHGLRDFATFYKYNIVSSKLVRDWDSTEDKICLNIFDVKNKVTALDGERTLDANLLNGEDYIKKISSTEIGLDEFDIPVAEDGVVRDKVADLEKMPTIDGKFDEGEWGEPIIVTNPYHCEETWGNPAEDFDMFWIHDHAYFKPYQTAKVYMTNDDKNIYLAASVDEAELDTSVKSVADLEKGAHFGFTLSKYDEKTGVPRFTYDGDGKDYEIYTEYTFGLLNGKTKTQVCDSQGIGKRAQAIPEENYQVTYDPEARTYYYEIKLPIDVTNIDLYDTTDATVSFSMAADRREGSDGANRFNMTAAKSSLGGAENFIHADSSLKVTLNDKAKDVWVLKDAPKLNGEIKIDGKIEDAWGKAVVSTSPTHCQETWGAMDSDGYSFWSFDYEGEIRYQNAKLYVTNDEKYLYVGATIDECDFDESCTDLAKLYAAAHFGFSVSGYDKENTVKHINYPDPDGPEYEQFTGFMMGFVNGKKASTSNTMGHERWDLPDEDYAVFYDPETRTYTYECRIPFSKTNITSPEIAISASFGCSYTGYEDENGNPATNRYNITTGYARAKCIAEDFSHKDNALHLNLAIVPDTGDSFNFFAVIAICAVALTACTALVVVKRKVK